MPGTFCDLPWGALMKRSFLRSLGITSLVLTISSPLFAFDEASLPGTDLIYGNDDRVEIDQYSETSYIEKAQSIALRVPKRRLTEDRNNPERILFPNIPLKSSMPQICADERFSEQVSLGNCSGFLVGPKTLVTAGHCMLNEKECADNKWVFGFKDNTTELKSSQVYSCKKINTQRYVYNEKEVSDYAVIELDRNVEGYVPLKTRKFGRVLLNTPLVVIGHPMGLPMKATDGAVVSRMNDIERETKIRSFFLRSHYFTANLDSYGGNSGSPVFNKRNGKVEGILVQGAEDFVYNPQKECLESRHLTNSHLNTYEKVMRINKVPGL
ncbi:trypsin-like peptidase [Bacteriovorax stolpii]|nr:trypsin-like peptidase [Bacteriovorax stolpii]